MLQACESEAVWSGGYWTYVVINAILIILHILLLGHTLYQLRVYRNDTKFTKSRMMRSIYILMQIMALLWLSMDCLLYSIDPHSHLLRHSSLCQNMAYAVYYIPGIFYALYLYQIVLRLQTSFKGSYLELSRWTLSVFKVLTLFIPISITICLVMDSPQLTCFAGWYIPNTDTVVTICHIMIGDLWVWKTGVYGVVILLINILNASFGIIFTFKLRQIVGVKQDTDSPSTQQQRHRKLESVVIRNDILTVIGCCSTLWSYILVLWIAGPLFVNMDLFVNCLVIGLMFHSNEWYYTRCCAICIRGCSKWCGPNRKRKRKMVHTQGHQQELLSSPLLLTVRNSTIQNVA